MNSDVEENAEMSLPGEMPSDLIRRRLPVCRTGMVPLPPLLETSGDSIKLSETKREKSIHKHVDNTGHLRNHSFDDKVLEVLYFILQVSVLS